MDEHNDKRPTTLLHGYVIVEAEKNDDGRAGKWKTMQVTIQVDPLYSITLRTEFQNDAAPWQIDLESRNDKKETNNMIEKAIENGDEHQQDGQTVEVVDRNGIRIVTTRDAQGNIIDVKKYVKEVKQDRTNGPGQNQEQRPI